MNGESVDKDDEDREARLDFVTAAYVKAQEAGEEPDGRQWLARYPELAPELRQFIEGKDFVDRVVAAIPVEPLTGSRLGGYRIEKLIGRGGMGDVYEAVNRDGLRVALKILPACALTDPRDRERFRREAEVIATLDHPNIIALLEAGDQAGIPFVAMSWIDGPNLRSVIRQLRHVPPTDENVSSVSLRVTLPGSPDAFAPLTSDQPRWRAAALIGLQVARALAHAHACGVLHRDIKPANLLLGSDGVISVADFGLARSDDHPDLTETGDVAGTLRYTAPERFRRWCDNRSDLYSLGLTLYELLTLRPAFDAVDRGLLLRTLIEDTPPRPRSLAREIPRDLETIVLKLIEKEPGHRYPSSEDLADDLERFLDGQPILARRLNPARRVWSWARKHRVRSIAVVFATVVSIGFLVAALEYLRMRAETATARTAVAQAERDKALAVAREAQFQSLRIKSQRNRYSLRQRGWRKRGWDLVHQAVALHPGDPTVRDQALATLDGLDGLTLIKQWEYGASSLAFDGSGKLLLGGLGPEDRQDARTKLLDIATREVQDSEQLGPGPVAFPAAGEPVQLAQRGDGVLVLRDIAGRKDRARYDVPGGGEVSVSALAADGSRAAAATDTAVHVWDGLSGRLLVSLPERAGALAITSDGRLLALGSESGLVRVVSLPHATQVAEFPAGRMPIQCLAFGLDPRRDPDGRQGWLLAAGGSGNPLVVYDLANKNEKSVITAHDGVPAALAFSPDGSILAEVGLGATLRDVASGRPILNLEADHLEAVAFSPDGRRLALARRTSFAPGTTTLVDFEPGQGVLTLRGLDSPVSKVAFSRDGSVVAAIARSWKAAVWDRPTGRLRLVVDAPRGPSEDNCALAVSPDGGLLALSAGREVQLWDIKEGRRLRTWDFEPALADQLGFPSPDRLLSFRAESPTGKAPRVGLIRDLLGKDPRTPLGRTPLFPTRIFSSAASPDGRFFAVEGVHDGPSGPRRRLRVFDGTTGMERWSRANEVPGGFGAMAIDSAGQILAIMTKIGPYSSETFDLADGRPRGSWPGNGAILGPGAVLWALVEPVSLDGLFASPVLRRGRNEILARFPSDEGVTPLSTVFSPDGRHMAYGHDDGTVTVCDLEEVRHRLSEVGLDW